ncbi:MAG: thioredoxin family protein [Holosporaceae bacterium]|nr:thioredoxin family protein [Holosporaceae bacterium]
MKTEYRFLSENDILCHIIFEVPEGCKIPKKPTISTLKCENLANFFYDSSGMPEKIAANKYKVDFSIAILDITNKNNFLQLKIECPLCEGDGCRIIFTHTDLSFSHSWQYEFLIIMFFGFLGGLILNFMPCVLPVLLMKLKALFSPDRKMALRGAIAGNYVSFLSFALLPALLKAGSEPVEWGLHFQNFNFLKITTIGLFLLVLQAFEVTNIISPSFRLKNVSRGVFVENFLSSVVASMVAIPCTAPFLGTAAVFALNGSAAETFLIFLAIATGFSLPYIGAMFLPMGGISGNLTKYSAAAKKLIDCGVLIAFGWMFWLLSNHLSNMIILMYVLIFSLCLWLFRTNRSTIAGILVAALLFTPEKWRPSQSINVPVTSNCRSRSPEDIAGEISAALTKNRPVILSISADWCLTCHYNKLRLLNDSDVQKLIKEKNILFIEIDLTERGDEWTAFIRLHGRSGIPFMMIYGPRFPQGRLLPEIPSVHQLLEAINSASQPSG